jgi:NAD(P)-dependent dehydrogenase (short-subunit alcohol dehydrogenase family)
MNDLSDMRNRVCLLTGASSGLGLATAAGLARVGADLILVCRDQRRGERARQWIAAQTPSARLGLHLANFEILDDVRALCGKVLNLYPAVHVLINNAGAIYETWRRTPDGFEATWQVNHLAPFLLTNLLLDRLIASAPARVVTVASGSHKGARINFESIDARHGYTMLKAYGRSKLANVLFAFELARRLAGRNITSNCLHPGMVATHIGNRGGIIGLTWQLMKPFLLTPAQGAATTLYLAGSPEVAHITGRYFVDSRIASPDPIARNRELQSRLWDLSAAMTGLASLRA